MGKHGYQGVSHSDRAVNGMDKFIKREAKKQNKNSALPLRRKDDSIPMHLWPLKDQLEHFDNMSDEEKFTRKYDFRKWHDEILEKSGMYPITFNDCVRKHHTTIKEMFDRNMLPLDAMYQLRKQNIIH